jgi:hypothetical protein
MPPSKYKVSPANERRFNGRTYGSKAEMGYAKILYNQRYFEEIVDFVEQPRVWLGVPENVYVPDFLVVAHGRPFYVDVKGVETQKFKRDKKLWSSYGWLDLHIVKKSGKNYKTTEVIHGQAKLRHPHNGGGDPSGGDQHGDRGGLSRSCEIPPPKR